MNKKNKIIVGVGTAVAVLAIGTFGFVEYNNAQEHKAYDAKIEKAIKDIDSDYKKFDISKDDKIKLQDLKKLKEDLSKYNKTSDPDKKVQDKYKSSIAEGEKYFTDKNSKNFNDLNVKKENKKSLNDKINKLNELEKVADSEKEIVYSNVELNNFKHEISSLKTKYSNQVKVLEKEEKAKADKQKEEAKKVEETKAKEQKAQEAQKQAEVAQQTQQAQAAADQAVSEQAANDQQAQEAQTAPAVQTDNGSQNYDTNNYSAPAQAAPQKQYQAPAQTQQAAPAAQAPANNGGGKDYVQYHNVETGKSEGSNWFQDDGNTTHAGVTQGGKDVELGGWTYN